MPRLFLIAPFMVISLVLILGVYRYSPHPPSPPNVGTFWQFFPRPQHSYAESNTHAGEAGDVVVHADPQDEDRLSPPQLNVHSDSQNIDAEDTDNKISSGLSLVDGIRVTPPPPPADTEEYLAICLLVKEDPDELREFFTHHYYHHGIRRFYVYDDGSNRSLSSYPPQSTYNVPPSALNFTFIEPLSVNTTSRKRLQPHTMERCIKEHGHKHHWLGLLDPDEFIEMRHPLYPSLLGWLRHWEERAVVEVGDDTTRSQDQDGKVPKKGTKLKVGGLGVSWLPHNSANLTNAPASGGFRHNFNECVAGGPAANNTRGDFWMVTHTKSFVRPEAVQYIQNIHLPKFQDGWTRFSEQGDYDFPASLVPPTHEYWALHHYATGSRKQFEAKQSKGRSQGPGMWPVDETYWDRYHKDVTTYRCDEMTKYNP